jgi:hypothetical protein
MTPLTKTHLVRGCSLVASGLLLASILFPGTSQAVRADAACDPPVTFSSSADGTAPECFWLQVPDTASALTVQLTPRQGQLDLYNHDDQVTTLTNDDLVNADYPIDTSVSYTIPLGGSDKDTLAVGGVGSFHLDATAQTSDQVSNSCAGGGCITIFVLTVNLQKGVPIGPKFGDRAIFPIEVGEPGTISADATWTGPASSLALILNGPDRMEQPSPRAAYARVDGRSPLHLSYNVTPADYSNGRKWRVSLVNFTSSGGQDVGQVSIKHPLPPAADTLARNASLQDFAGMWTNVDPSTRGITRIQVQPDSAGAAVHSWGACVPTECDQGTSEASATGNPLQLTHVFSFKKETLTLWLLATGQMLVVDDNVFTDGTKRDYASELRFQRQSKPAAVDMTAAGYACGPGTSPAFDQGFLTLQGFIGAAMGQARTCPYADPAGTGDTEQNTTLPTGAVGLAFWRKCANTDSFTDGYDHWAYTNTGVQVMWTGVGLPPDPPNSILSPADQASYAPCGTT